MLKSVLAVVLISIIQHSHTVCGAPVEEKDDIMIEKYYVCSISSDGSWIPGESRYLQGHECINDFSFGFCLVDPCQMASCPGIPNAVCEAERCNGCKRRFVENKIDVTDKCNTCSHITCGECNEICTLFPSATCIRDSCDNCKPKFYYKGYSLYPLC